MKQSIVFTFTLLLFSNVWAAVWTVTPGSQWTDQWESRYVEWVATQVTGDYFKRLGSPYASIPMDCADVQYALRAYFAMKNGLPFSANGGSLTQNSDAFDDYPAGDRRLAAFIRYLAATYWTETLAYQDTFPPAVSDLRPGDLFMYKVTSNGKYIRHTYIIKNINPDGTFDVLFSTQENAANGGALFRRPSYMFRKAPVNGGGDSQRWGFRRMKRPQYMGWDQYSVPGSSSQQYQWANQYTAAQFFGQVKRTNQTIAESPQMMVRRNFSGICTTLTERIEIVNKALSHVNALGGACMNYADYDAHSTPSRDSGLMDSYDAYEFDYQTIVDQGQTGQVQQNYRQLTELIFDHQMSESEQSFVREACPVIYAVQNGQRYGTDMGTFRVALFAGRVSFHPNDNVFRRWGFNSGSATTCTEHYGYPE